MAGLAAGFRAGVRLSDPISLGVIARTVLPERVRQVLVETGKASEHERDLPAPVWSTTPLPWRSAGVRAGAQQTRLSK